MDEKIKLDGNYQIEVSGWGLDDVFFVEQSNLFWAEDGDKRVMLRHAVPEGAVVFVQLLSTEPSFTSLPVAYHVRGVQPMNSDGLCEMRLLQVQPQSREHLRSKIASISAVDSSKGYETTEDSIHADQEEVLYEA
jgi:hypothetical protein